MPNISISVSDKIAQVSGSPVIVCGNSDYTVNFTLDSEWDTYEQKTAEFRYWRGGERKKAEVLFSGSSVSVPVLRDIDEVEIGLCAGDLHTSTPAQISCARSITDGDAVHDPPAPDVYAQLMEYLASLQNGGANVAVARLRLRGTADAGIGSSEVIPISTETMTSFQRVSVSSSTGEIGTSVASGSATSTAITVPANASHAVFHMYMDSGLRLSAYVSAYDADGNFINRCPVSTTVTEYGMEHACLVSGVNHVDTSAPVEIKTIIITFYTASAYSFPVADPQTDRYTVDISQIAGFDCELAFY